MQCGQKFRPVTNGGEKVAPWLVLYRPEVVLNKGFSILRHLQGKGCKTGLCGQAWSFPFFDPM